MRFFTIKTFCYLSFFLLPAQFSLFAESPSLIPKSSGSILNADLENHSEGYVQPLNAGVRWLGDPFSGRTEGIVQITNDFAYEGNRAAYIASQEEKQIARIRFQSRFDAPSVKEDTVCEFMFRAVKEHSQNIEGMTLWKCSSSTGKPAGLTLTASGSAKEGTFHIDILHGSNKKEQSAVLIKNQVPDLPQNQWIHFILHREKKNGQIHLWIGKSGQEKLVGVYPDLNPEADLHSIELGDTSHKKYYGSGYWDNIRLGAPLKEGEKLAPAEPKLRNVNEETFTPTFPIEVNSKKQLFIDDLLIESNKGFTRKLHPVNKYGHNPLIVPEKPWEGKSVLLYGSVIQDPATNKFRMWYLAWGKHVGQPSFVCYAESDDGIKWNKPNLGLHEFNGSKENNIIMPAWSQTTVLYDKNDPDPSRRFKAVLRLNGIRAFFSPDGYHWKDKGNIIEQGYDGTTVHRDPINQKWIAMVKIFRNGKRARGYAESTDFLNWTDTYFMTSVDKKDLPGDQMYAIYMFHYETAYFGLLRMYNTDSDKVDIQLMTSRNAKS